MLELTASYLQQLNFERMKKHLLIRIAPTQMIPKLLDQHLVQY